MIERKYVEYELAKGKKDICIVCNCKNAETLNTFLCSDVRPFEEWIKSDFDKVLSGEIISKEISGNVCCAEINFKNTKIYNMLIEDDDEYYEDYLYECDQHYNNIIDDDYRIDELIDSLDEKRLKDVLKYLLENDNSAKRSFLQYINSEDNNINIEDLKESIDCIFYENSDDEYIGYDEASIL